VGFFILWWGGGGAPPMAGLTLPESDGTIQADVARHASMLVAPEAQEAFGTAAETDTGKLRVMVVEDQLDTATMLAALLTAWGFEAEVAHTGAEALRVASEFSPRVVLLDLGLPDQHGYRLARQLREEAGASSPMSFVVVTGWSQRVDQELSAAAGISYHLVKPVNPDALHSILQRYDESSTAH
jgi:CheY-like chemotaxis protein